jgi:hypothetical protein
LQSDCYILGNPNRIHPREPPNHTHDRKRIKHWKEKERGVAGENTQKSTQRSRNPSQRKKKKNRSTTDRKSQKGEMSSSVTAEQRAHPFKSERMEHERRKDRIRQGVATFLTTSIITMIVLNTGTRNTSVHEKGTRTQQLQPGQYT